MHYNLIEEVMVGEKCIFTNARNVFFAAATTAASVHPIKSSANIVNKDEHQTSKWNCKQKKNNVFHGL